MKRIFLFGLLLATSMAHAQENVALGTWESSSFACADGSHNMAADGIPGIDMKVVYEISETQMIVKIVMAPPGGTQSCELAMGSAYTMNSSGLVILSTGGRSSTSSCPNIAPLEVKATDSKPAYFIVSDDGNTMSIHETKPNGACGKSTPVTTFKRIGN